MILKHIKMNRNNFLLLFAVAAGLFLVLDTIMTIILVTLHPDGAMPLFAGVFVLFAVAFASFFSGLSLVGVDFGELLRFGLTRRTALAATLAQMGLEAIWAATLSWGFSLLDQLVARTLWLSLQPSLTFDVLPVPVWVFPLVPLGVMLAALVTGAAVQRFGRMALWLPWAVGVLPAILSDLIPWDRLFTGMAAVLPIFWILLAVVFAGCVILSLWYLLRRSYVRA